MRRVARCLLHAPWLALLATLPLRGYYTSFGIDVETVEDGELHGHYWRLRWPGDGSVVARAAARARSAVAAAVEWRCRRRGDLAAPARPA